MLPRKRKRYEKIKPSLLNEPVLKKGKLKLQIKWNIGGYQINDDQKRILHNITMTIQNSTTPVLCFDLCKYIAEYALGNIKRCPSCYHGEVMVCRHSNYFSVWKCNKCVKYAYIHTCDSIMENNRLCQGWWVESHLQEESRSYPEPGPNSCYSCCKKIISRNKKQGTLDDIRFFPKICKSCSYECHLCGFLFCRKKHLSYLCYNCDAHYCHQCTNHSYKKYKNKCINCQVGTQFKEYLILNQYQNVHDRLLFLSIFSRNFPQISKSKTIPIQVLRKIDSFVNEAYYECEYPECNLSKTVYVAGGLDENNISFKFIYTNSDDINRKGALKCNRGHYHYYHRCNLNHNKYDDDDPQECRLTINSISPLKYYSYSPDSTWYSNWGTQLHRYEIQHDLCTICAKENINNDKIGKLNYNIISYCCNCAYWCFICNSFFCQKHIKQCDICNNKQNCIDCNWINKANDEVRIADCIVCNYEVCTYCRKYKWLCTTCYCMMDNNNYNLTKSQYIYCCDIIDSLKPSKMSLKKKIVYIIAAYVISY